MKSIRVMVTNKQHYKFKLDCARRNRTMSDVIRELIGVILQRGNQEEIHDSDS